LVFEKTVKEVIKEKIYFFDSLKEKSLSLQVKAVREMYSKNILFNGRLLNEDNIRGLRHWCLLLLVCHS